MFHLENYYYKHKFVEGVVEGAIKLNDSIASHSSTVNSPTIPGNYWLNNSRK